MSDNVKDPWSEDEAEKAGSPDQQYGSLPDERQAEKSGSTDQQYGNLSVEDDAGGTVDPADLAGGGGSRDDGEPESP